jgi:hypothetical protein
LIYVSQHTTLNLDMPSTKLQNRLSSSRIPTNTFNFNFILITNKCKSSYSFERKDCTVTNEMHWISYVSSAISYRITLQYHQFWISMKCTITSFEQKDCTITNVYHNSNTTQWIAYMFHYALEIQVSRHTPFSILPFDLIKCDIYI